MIKPRSFLRSCIGHFHYPNAGITSFVTYKWLSRLKISSCYIYILSSETKAWIILACKLSSVLILMNLNISNQFRHISIIINFYINGHIILTYFLSTLSLDFRDLEFVVSFGAFRDEARRILTIVRRFGTPLLF